jgi:hypothetical protein
MPVESVAMLHGRGEEFVSEIRWTVFEKQLATHLTKPERSATVFISFED